MKKRLAILLVGIIVGSNVMAADNITEALTTGKASVDMRLRYESVDQDNALADAKSLTLRSRLGYTTGDYKGFSATMEGEDVRIVGGVDDYTVGPTGFNPGVYSVIADPETTEVDQGYIQYKNELMTAKLGRQVITYDGHRFVGHVGWRQDRQTFDALSFAITPMTGLELKYSYIDKRNRIFAEAADIDSKDHLLNASYKTPIGKLTGYAYLLEVDNNTSNALDTYGISLNGSKKADSLKFLYTAEYASQESENGAATFDADYLFLEAGIVFSGITAKLGYEVLGSDSGAYGFSTPLATLHKFNGWSDQFLGTPAQGLEDLYLAFSGKLVGGVWKVIYHDFNADKPSAAVDDLGSELDLMYVKKYGKHYSAGIKYAAYSAGDVAAGKVDTDKLWVWLGVKF